MKDILLLLMLIFLNFDGNAQKQVIDKAAVENWASLRDLSGQSCILSKDGKYITYQYGSLANGNSIVLRALEGDFKKEFHHATYPTITEDSKLFIAIIPGDSILLYDLVKKVLPIFLELFHMRQPKPVKVAG